jgi:hypothetical protein
MNEKNLLDKITELAARCALLEVENQNVRSILSDTIDFLIGCDDAPLESFAHRLMADERNAHLCQKTRV